MALKISLKPGERIVIGGAVVTNGSSKTELFFENKVPILRDKDIMNESDAYSPARRIYFVVQLMYIDENHLTLHHKNYWKFVNEFIKAAPSSLTIVDQMNDQILKCQYYAALKTAKSLIDYEQEVISRVS
ncbi:putative flagellum biosynthesis repressor protein FlbT [Desulfosarcina alkanivorans]|jgi:flagellar protein FlbT|uniref:Putative flagellum biosynthesis repressor protein FlbT n=1 Tax=Desulfosarcina alkanivorans TaxID=571177 RepID=A0A5K7YFE3_9BACT|nr:flagellar biosynthesis repressor FlbT [Desulfosarcina alkanivorans]BBO66750.1 putative flagellum biosynthesis repressor protein FlbT [Desulfosarcina alkanivorans]